MKLSGKIIKVYHNNLFRFFWHRKVLANLFFIDQEYK
ncbi:hypothetical protein SEES8400_13397 [Salmonella enterica subsp. enterica serovar Senftenberg str. ATCC 8400]|nr:hypothetical protein SEES004_02888 [Salmonella enterica subsp. enterica serovar Senftenberg str. 361154004]ESF37407.1 hypothetical protein SEES8400_13397 [Salmonella enterica subsp. enterica serovar Senftenberg str. ATCC 8400]